MPTRKAFWGPRDDGKSVDLDRDTIRADGGARAADALLADAGAAPKARLPSRGRRAASGG